jgi:hypothetical protein
MKSNNSGLFGRDTSVLTPGQRAIHTYVIGQPGTGKSRALEAWIMQDILAGHGVGVIDPHGDLYRNLLLRLAPKHELWKRLVILDPLNPKWVVGFNPLEVIHGLSQERLALFLTDVVVKVWSLNTSNAPRMVWLLTNSFLALSDLGLSLLDLPRFLLDREYRECLLPRLSNEAVYIYFRHEFPNSDAATHQWVTPVLNKIGGLIFDPDVRLMFSGGSRLNFREILDQQLILLVNIPKGILGEGSSALLGAFIVAHLQQAALSRANSSKRVPFYLYLDEFQNYTTDNIKDILSESRKYALSLTLAHQYLDQLSGDLRSAVLNTAGTIISFRVGYNDATRLAKEIFPSPDYLTSSKIKVQLGRYGLMPFPTIRNHQDSLGWNGLALLLTKLQPRQFWARHRGFKTPAKQRTFNMPDPQLTIQHASYLNAMLACSGMRYGRLKEDVQREFNGKRSWFKSNHDGSDTNEVDYSCWTR